KLSGVAIGASNAKPDEAASAVLTCDALLVSGGWAPALHLLSHAGGELTFDDRRRCLVPSHIPAHISLQGDCADRALVAEHLGPRVSPVARKKSRMWVDLRHDVTVADIELAVQENFRSVEHVKRHTTLGMASDQGKTSAVAGLEILSDH